MCEYLSNAGDWQEAIRAEQEAMRADRRPTPELISTVLTAPDEEMACEAVTWRNKNPGVTSTGAFLEANEDRARELYHKHQRNVL